MAPPPFEEPAVAPPLQAAPATAPPHEEPALALPSQEPALAPPPFEEPAVAPPLQAPPATAPPHEEPVLATTEAEPHPDLVAPLAHEPHVPSPSGHERLVDEAPPIDATGPASPQPLSAEHPHLAPSSDVEQGTQAEVSASEPAPVELRETRPEQVPGTAPPAAEAIAPAPQATVEHAALEHESDEPDHGPAGHEPGTALPAVNAIDGPAAPPVRRAMSGAAGRIPPPPQRRDALLQRRARRLQRDRNQPLTARSMLRPGRIFALLALVGVIVLLWFLVSLFQPLKGSGHGQVVVVIPHGAGAHAIGNLLASRGVVSSGFFFDLRAAVDGQRGQLHSGVYTFKRDMSYAAALAELVKPPPPPPVVRVLIPEGDARSMIARIARDDGLAGNYLAASRRSPVLDPTNYGAPRTTPNLEGFLYPATYDLKAGTDAKGLVGQQLAAFMQHFGPPQAPAARALHVTLYDLLIVASMVEREALLSRDRPLVAAVIYNRLRMHIPLGIDATIRYALNNWSTPLTESDLRIDSRYNTRLHLGLPPTPIGNPGMASIDAAAHPAHVPYLYYVDGSDGCGDLRFSTSFAQFQADSAAYQAAVAGNGGRVPRCKK